MESTYEPPSRAIGTREILIAMRRSWALVLACAVLGGLALAGLTMWLQPQTYSSTAVLLVNQEVASDLLLPLPQQDDPERVIENETTFAESRSVEVRAEDELGFEASITATPRAAADVLEITATEETAERSQQVASAFTTAYLDLRVEADQALLDQTIRALEDETEQLKIEMDAATNAAARDRLMTRIEDYERSINDLRVSSSAATGGVVVVAEPDLPPEPTSPNTVRNGLIGVILGLALGTTLAVVRFGTDDRVRSPAEIEAALPGVVVLGEVPHLPAPGTNGVPQVLDDEATTGDSVPYRDLASAIQNRLSGRDPRLVVVLGLDDTIAVGELVGRVALANARTGKNTIAIDANLTAPSLHRVFGTSDSPGILSLSRGESTPWEAFRKVDFASNLRLLTADADATADPGLLFGEEASRFFQTVGLLDQDFLALIAGPDLDAGGPALASALEAAVVIVVREGSSRLTRVREALRRFDRVGLEVAGLVLDRERPVSS